MILFSNEKEIIFKITNAILLIWLVAAIAISCGSVITLLVKEPVQKYTYSEYEVINCSYYKGEDNITEEESAQRCLADYNNYNFNNKNSDYYKWITLYTSIANVIIVGGVMYFINRSKKVKK